MRKPKEKQHLMMMIEQNNDRNYKENIQRQNDTKVRNFIMTRISGI